MQNSARNSNPSSELKYHVKINRENEKTYRITRENSGKSRKNVCHNSLIPQYLSGKFSGQKYM